MGKRAQWVCPLTKPPHCDGKCSLPDQELATLGLVTLNPHNYAKDVKKRVWALGSPNLYAWVGYHQTHQTSNSQNLTDLHCGFGGGGLVQVRLQVVECSKGYLYISLTLSKVTALRPGFPFLCFVFTTNMDPVLWALIARYISTSEKGENLLNLFHKGNIYLAFEQSWPWKV